MEPLTLSYHLAMNAQVRLTSLLGPSPLPNINEFINTSKLPLSATPYSIAPSASANRLWSSICSFFFIFIFIFFRKRKGIYGWFLEHPLLNTWTRGTSRLASFLDKGVASSSVHFSPYIHLTSFLISPISSLLIFREREFVTLRTLLLSSCWPHCLCYRSFAEA